MIEIGYELILCRYLQIVSRLGLPVVHGIFLHTHECRVLIRFGIGVALAQFFQMIIVLLKLVTMFLQLFDLLLPFLLFLPFFFVFQCRRPIQRLFLQLINNVCQH